MCWYLYYIPCTMIPTLGLNAAILMGEEEEKNTRVRTLALCASGNFISSFSYYK